MQARDAERKGFDLPSRLRQPRDATGAASGLSKLQKAFDHRFS